ncbi:hypothetical protein F8388_019311 [Cannabis sativa]|uniref:CCHC-type domain-containing protein n=1 Tax=Cannabis sativa TaxID=3483 RepID=A0A7J6GZB6_CANSA|nr:hypothetical protein F8388_019311 [Cannabis sativa]KAF4388334.1 hypothetical protein G4B88_013171 [Cannabis sativa]
MIRGRQPRRGNSKFRDQSKFRNHSRHKGNSRSKSRPKETRKCYHCGKVGHLIRNCWELRDKKMQNKDEEDKGNDSNVAVDDHYSSNGDRSVLRERESQRTEALEGYEPWYSWFSNQSIMEAGAKDHNDQVHASSLCYRNEITVGFMH